MISMFPAASGSPPAWSEVFGNHNPVEVEIGPGKGSFLLGRAHSCPQRNFFGVEYSRRRAHCLARRIAEDRLPNALTIAADFNCVVRTLFRAASVATYHLYFPDPWWKRRHQRRRLVQADLTGVLERTLVAGGEIFVASDVHAYYLEIVQQLGNVPRLHRFPWERDLTNAGSAVLLTDFERHYRAQGRPLYYAGFRKR